MGKHFKCSENDRLHFVRSKSRRTKPLGVSDHRTFRGCKNTCLQFYRSVRLRCRHDLGSVGLSPHTGRNLGSNFLCRHDWAEFSRRVENLGSTNPMAEAHPGRRWNGIRPVASWRGTSDNRPFLPVLHGGSYCDFCSARCPVANLPSSLQ